MSNRTNIKAITGFKNGEGFVYHPAPFDRCLCSNGNGQLTDGEIPGFLKCSKCGYHILNDAKFLPLVNKAGIIFSAKKEKVNAH